MARVQKEAEDEQMKALTFHGSRTIRYETVDEPKVTEPTDAIVKVRLCAICGSDMHAYHGRESGMDTGTVMGHEFTGEVVELGSGVETLEVGKQVLSPFTTNCGDCFYCDRGLTARCVKGQLFGYVEDGSGLQGGQAEYVRVPLADSTLAAIPADVSPEEALLLGDVFSTGYFCAQQARVEPGSNCAIIGCGPVGLMAVVGARELGADRIFAFDSIPERLELAGSFGATPIDFKSVDPVAVVHEATQGRGVDAALDAVGTSASTRAAYELVRPGATISVVGVHYDEHFPFSPPNAYAYDKNLTFTVGRCPARRVMRELIPVVQARKYDLASIISHRLPLAQGSEAYRLFDEKRDRCTKVVLTAD
jgi:threonine dehydrogenase-like Zn-dependent dehydrogenase